MQPVGVWLLGDRVETGPAHARSTSKPDLCETRMKSISHGPGSLDAVPTS